MNIWHMSNLYSCESYSITFLKNLLTFLGIINRDDQWIHLKPGKTSCWKNVQLGVLKFRHYFSCLPQVSFEPPNNLTLLILCFSRLFGTSQVALALQKDHLPMQMWFWFLCWEDALEEGMASNFHSPLLILFCLYFSFAYIW